MNEKPCGDIHHFGKAAKYVICILTKGHSGDHLGVVTKNKVWPQETPAERKGRKRKEKEAAKAMLADMHGGADD